MTDYEFELEVCAYRELQQILRGDKRPGPSRAFVELVKQMTADTEPKPSETPVTPEELGWEK